MEFRKMVSMTLHVRQQKRHGYKEQTDFWTLWEKARVGWFQRIALKHVYYHKQNRSPVQVRCMKAACIEHAQGWCTGMTLRDGMGRELGGRVRMGNTCTPMTDSCQCMTKTTKKKRIYLFIHLLISYFLSTYDMKDSNFTLGIYYY